MDRLDCRWQLTSLILVPTPKDATSKVKGFYLAFHYPLTSTHEQFAALPRLSLVGLLD